MHRDDPRASRPARGDPSALTGRSAGWSPACGRNRPACIGLLLWRVPGLFVVNKPRGPSSFDIIRRARGELGVRKIGHAGTLDPAAEGVLVLGAGRGTKLLPLFSEAGKSYRVRLALGVRTDTYDLAGQVIEERDASGVTEQALRGALDRFRGAIEQVPPMYSALKREGTPLYKLARRGVEVERKARRVEIARLSLVEFSPPEAALDLDCSKGTYVRSLVEDIGQALGCGAAVTALTRTRVGPFTLEDARPPGGLLG